MSTEFEITNTQLLSDKEPIEIYDHTISFVYFNVSFNALALILFVLFFIYAYNERDRIYRHHDTISSFCAEKNSWGSRFLLSFTCIVGVNMLCLHVEEYNSRPEELDEWFWITIGCIFPLPLVGMCYTRGKRYDEREEVIEEITVEPTSRISQTRRSTAVTAQSKSDQRRKSTELSDLRTAMAKSAGSELDKGLLTEWCCF